MDILIRKEELMCSMSLSRPREAPMPEPLPCPECGEERLARSVENHRVEAGLTIERLRLFKCRACGACFLDDDAVHRIQRERAKRHVVA